MLEILTRTHMAANTTAKPTTGIVYRVDGRILRTVATGPFHDELVAAIPADISELILALERQGKWGQIAIFERNAYVSAEGLAEFTRHLKNRYPDPDKRPVTALVFGASVAHADRMAPCFQRCFEAAGVECGVFEDDSTAQYWVASKIRQTSDAIAWKEDYRIGDSGIDEQHQELFLRAGDVLSATTRESQTLCALRLFQYARMHFSHEESLMRRLAYPDMESHLQQHEMLIARLDAFSHNMAKNTLVKAELEEFIAHWFLNHIAHVDTRLAAYIRAT